MELYNEKQYFKLFILLMLIPVIAIIISFINSQDSPPAEFYPIAFILFMLLFLNFYKLDIRINQEKMIFGL